MPTPKRRRPSDEDDTPLSVLPSDDDDEPDDDDEEDELEPAPSYVRRRPSSIPRDDEDDGDASQIVPDRIVRLALPHPWKVLRIYAWLDYQEDIASLFQPKRDDETIEEAGQRIMDGLRKVIVKHDGWRDGSGHVYPQPTKRAFWEQIPNPLATAIGTAFRSAVRSNPTPQASRKTKRRA